MPKSSNNNKIPPFPSILIILMGSLGDIVRALCLVTHIKLHWPQCRVSWLVETRWTELIRIHCQIDSVIKGKDKNSLFESGSRKKIKVDRVV
jgi:ADP-heptose:LPS heptosyltransferase